MGERNEIDFQTSTYITRGGGELVVCVFTPRIKGGFLSFPLFFRSFSKNRSDLLLIVSRRESPNRERRSHDDGTFDGPDVLTDTNLGRCSRLKEELIGNGFSRGQVSGRPGIQVEVFTVEMEGDLSLGLPISRRGKYYRLMMYKVFRISVYSRET